MDNSKYAVELLGVVKKIKRIEKEVLLDLKAYKKQLSDKVLEELQSSNSRSFSSEELGDIVLIKRKPQTKYDIEQLAKDYNIPMDELEKYKTVGKVPVYLKIIPKI